MAEPWIIVLAMTDGENRIRVVVWSELTEPRLIYPAGIHGAVAAGLSGVDTGLEISRSSIAGPDLGMGGERLADCDVLVYWSHLKHDDVGASAVARVAAAVAERGMGFLALHSSVDSGIMRSLLGTTCKLGSWREADEPERVKVLLLDHPIARGVSDFIIPREEMYGEPWDVPEPEAVVFESEFGKGERFRSGCCWRIGKGRVFYFRPGHETNRSYYQKEVIQVIANGVRWCANR